MIRFFVSPYHPALDYLCWISCNYSIGIIKMSCYDASRSNDCIIIRQIVNTQFRAYPFYKASEWMPHKKLLLNSIVF